MLIKSQITNTKSQTNSNFQMTKHQNSNSQYRRKCSQSEIYNAFGYGNFGKCVLFGICGLYIVI